MVKGFFLLCLLIFVSAKNDYYLVSYNKNDQNNHLEVRLEYKGEFKPEDYTNITFQNASNLTPIKNLKLTFDLECDKVLHLRIEDADNQRWEVPFTISDKYKEKAKTFKGNKTFDDFGIKFSDLDKKDQPFSYSFVSPKKDDEEVYYDTKESNFLFSDTFIAFGGYLTSNDIYGFGERFHNLKLGDGIFTLWPNDTSGIHEDFGDGGYNAMGSHPMGIHRTKKGNILGFILNNINAQDIVIRTVDDGKVSLEHRVIGGIVDAYYYLGKSYDDTLIQLHEIIGNPILPPYWSLGFHQSRWGYNNTEDVRNVMKHYIDLELPIDTFWGDVDILQDYKIFSLNKENYKDLPLLIYDMHQNGYHYVPIIDIGFAKDDSDPYYKEGVNTKAFILSNYTGNPLIGYVWPGEAVFPDFFTESAVDLWVKAMKDYHNIIEYDGAWIDMNEPAMIKNLDEGRGEILPKGKKFEPEKNMFEYIPYIPGYRLPDRTNLYSHTLSENAISQKLEENPFLVSYNFKPLMAFLQAKNTYKGLAELGKRPFILSRSTTLGAGKHTFHWLGDNFSNFRNMRNGLDGIFQFQIYGIPMVGDDICGFIGNSTDELCARWMNLGAFFPFSRNHNLRESTSQEPYAFGKDSKTLKVSKVALGYRYSLIRYFYTNLFLISLGKSGSFFKPLFFEFPDDLETYKRIDDSALIGNALYFIPAFTSNTTVTAYFPNEDWTTFPEGKVFNTFDKESKTGKEVELIYGFYDMHLYIRGGFIVPRQETVYPFVKNTQELRKRPTEIYIHPSSTIHEAKGDIIFDKDDIDTIERGDYLHVSMSFNHDTIHFTNENEFKTEYPFNDNILSYIFILRADYLEVTEKSYATVTYKSGREIIVPVNKLSDTTLKINLKKYNIKFSQINTVRIVKDSEELNSNKFLSVVE